jgi:uncharacterized protein (DUF362 family)
LKHLKWKASWHLCNSASGPTRKATLEGKKTMQDAVVLWQCEKAQYPEMAPFHPDQAYPELPFPEVGSKPNMIYHGVREVFRLSGLDREHFGRPEWNPLGGLVSPGEKVLLKPNFVKEDHPRDPQGWKYMLTHGSVIRAVADYIWKALKGTGHIILADGPQTDASFHQIVSTLQLDALSDFYSAHGVSFKMIDLRSEEWLTKDDVVVERQLLPGDPQGYVAFDLADKSEFMGHRGLGRYYGADYATDEVNQHHDGQRNEYLISRSAIECDVFFNLPKLKTHKKAGITVNLKNLVGINGNKNWLPHYTEGSPPDDGDQFPESRLAHAVEGKSVRLFQRLSLSVPGAGTWVHRQAKKVGRRIFGETEEVIRSGNWHGNDTIWRMCLDLNKIAMYGNGDGSFRKPQISRRKRHYCLVDGIMAGQAAGPLDPDPVPCGLIAFGLEPAIVDTVCAYLMGFDPRKIPIIDRAFHCRYFPLTKYSPSDIRCVSDRHAWNRALFDISPEDTFHFEPYFGWKGHIELD